MSRPVEEGSGSSENVSPLAFPNRICWRLVVKLWVHADEPSSHGVIGVLTQQHSGYLVSRSKSPFVVIADWLLRLSPTTNGRIVNASNVRDELASQQVHQEAGD